MKGSEESGRMFAKLHSASQEILNSTSLSSALNALLAGARELTSAEGGTIYLLDEHNLLHFFVMQNSRLELYGAQTPAKFGHFKDVPLERREGEINKASIAAAAASENRVVNIADIYHSDEYPLIGAKQFDEKMDYRTVSMLAVPIVGHRKNVIGVLQLVNHLDEDGEAITPFSPSDVCVAEILANQAAMHVENYHMHVEQRRLVDEVSKLNQIAIALSAEHNLDRMLEKILTFAKELTWADGGTLYLHREGKLHFEVMKNSSLNIHASRAAGNLPQLAPLEIYDADGHANDDIVAANVAAHKQSVKIDNIYENSAFNFSRVRQFDQDHCYHSKSMLAVPMINQKGDLVGVLQLVNMVDKDLGETRSFSADSQKIAESLAALAAVAVNNQRLNDELKLLLESFIDIISKAIDDKSPYTGGHCRRVPELSMMLVEAASKHDQGELADFHMSDEDMYEMKIASMLHDCGKITTPIHVVDKATKLETICDRIDKVALRYEIKCRDMMIDYLKGHSTLSDAELAGALRDEIESLKAELAFLRDCNTGGEYMAPEKQQRVREIAESYRWRGLDGKQHPMLEENEVYNLTIEKGTLTPEERDVINHHIVATINMLEGLPFPEHLKHVAEIAGGHHERMDGKGYPRGLTREQMSVQARVIGIADIFEALTAADRPYKKPMPLSQVMSIMEHMKDEGHIDPELFEIFKQHRIHLHYGRKFLSNEQIDVVA